MYIIIAIFTYRCSTDGLTSDTYAFGSYKHMYLSILSIKQLFNFLVCLFLLHIVYLSFYNLPVVPGFFLYLSTTFGKLQGLPKLKDRLENFHK